jgi:hypothetical protein
MIAEAYMRTSERAIRETPIAERTPPRTGPVTGSAVAKDETHVAFVTAANGFIVVVNVSGTGCTDRRTTVSALSAGSCIDSNPTAIRGR